MHGKKYLRGVDSTNGCRDFEEVYAGTYPALGMEKGTMCLCNTDLCNGAEATTTTWKIVAAAAALLAARMVT